jgi:hypothetical protein
MQHVYGMTLPGFSVTSQDCRDFLLKVGSVELYFYRELPSYFGRVREGNAQVFAAGTFRLSVQRFGRTTMLPALQDDKVAA